MIVLSNVVSTHNVPVDGPFGAWCVLFAFSDGDSPMSRLYVHLKASTNEVLPSAIW